MVTTASCTQKQKKVSVIQEADLSTASDKHLEWGKTGRTNQSFLWIKKSIIDESLSACSYSLFSSHSPSS